MFGLGGMEVLVILVIAFLLFGPKELPEIGRQLGKAIRGFKQTTDDLRQSIEPEINMIQQEMRMVEQDMASSMKEAEQSLEEASDDAGRSNDDTKSVQEK